MAAPRVIRSIREARTAVSLKKTGHPAAFRKLRCPVCKLGYAVESNLQDGKYVCGRCGAVLSNLTL